MNPVMAYINQKGKENTHINQKGKQRHKQNTLIDQKGKQKHTNKIRTIFVSKDDWNGREKANVHGRDVANKWIDKEKEKEGGESYTSGRF